MQPHPVESNSVDDALESWLKTLIAEKQFPPAALAEAMMGDGYSAGEANLLAAAAYIRYSGTRLANLARSESGRGTLEMLGQYARTAIVDSCPNILAEQPLKPNELSGNRIQLGDRTITLQLVARNPHVAVFGNVLSENECNALIEVGRARLQPDTVIDRVDGARVEDTSTRSSYGTFLRHDEFDWLKAIAQRVAELVHWPLARQEDIALSYYRAGQEFLPHCDYFDTLGSNIEELLHAGQRIATLVIYLNDVLDGGGTLFPQAGFEIRPQQGCGTYFTYQLPDGSPDPTSLHGGNPVIEGEKWIATFWFVEQDIERVS